MTNLYKETIDVLKENGKRKKDVLFVNISTNYFDSNKNVAYSIDAETFFEVAKTIDYDNGFGGAEILENLVICGKDFWLERHEYDGSEWWEFKQMPTMFERNDEIDNDTIKIHLNNRSRYWYE